MHKRYKQQSGAVLVISLIMLLLLTLIGITGMQTTSLEENMAGNMRDRNLAFQAAEAALIIGEAAASSGLTATCPGTNPAGYYLPMDVNCDGTKEALPVWNNAAIWSDDSKSVKYNTDGNAATIDLVNLSANPRYIIEDMGSTCASAGLPCPSADQRHNYRITSRATGGTTNAVVILQSTFQINAP